MKLHPKCKSNSNELINVEKSHTSVCTCLLHLFLGKNALLNFNQAEMETVIVKVLGSNAKSEHLWLNIGIAKNFWGEIIRRYVLMALLL